jgi:hypothetical protein
VILLRLISFEGAPHPRYASKPRTFPLNQRTFAVKHLSLDREDKRIREFARSFPVHPEGTVVELEGQPIFRVVPAFSSEIDPVKVKDAILNWRDASRETNQDWEGCPTNS